VRSYPGLAVFLYQAPCSGYLLDRLSLFQFLYQLGLHPCLPGHIDQQLVDLQRMAFAELLPDCRGQPGKPVGNLLAHFVGHMLGLMVLEELAEQPGHIGLLDSPGRKEQEQVGLAGQIGAPEHLVGEPLAGCTVRRLGLKWHMEWHQRAFGQAGQLFQAHEFLLSHWRYKPACLEVSQLPSHKPGHAVCQLEVSRSAASQLAAVYKQWHLCFLSFLVGVCLVSRLGLLMLFSDL